MMKSWPIPNTSDQGKADETVWIHYNFRESYKD